MGKDKRGRNVLVLLLCFVLSCSICAFCVSGASILLTELISKESSGDSKEPAFAIDSAGTIHAVWVDETDLSVGISGAASSLSINNGPDKDIFFNYREGGAWSTPVLGSDYIIKGGVQVISNESILTSIQPDIEFDSNNVSYIVWSALTPPEKLIEDDNTLFLMHFDDASSLENADYSAGDSTVMSLGTQPENAKITTNAVIGDALYLSGKKAYMNFSALDNFDSTQGTIEFWFSSITEFQERFSAVSMPVYLFNSTNNSRYMLINLGGYNEEGAFVVMSDTEYITSESSYFYPFRGNEWHHVAVTYDLTTLSSSAFKLYIDGYLTGSGALNLRDPFLFDTLCIGTCNISDTSYTTDMRIDEFMVSNSVRSAEEIKQHAGNRSIFYRNITNNTIKSNQQMLTAGTNISYYPRIAVDSGKNIHLVYNDMHNRTSLAVRYMMRNSTSWSEPELVSNGTPYAYMPDIAVDLNKTAHVVWEEFSTSDINISYIHYEKKNFSGTWHDEENVSNASYSSFANHDFLKRSFLSSYFPKKPRIIMGSSNMTKIVWTDNINYPDPELLFYASFDESTNATFARGSSIVDQAAVSFENSSGTASIYYDKDIYYTRTGINITNESPDVTLSAHLNYSSASNFNPGRGSISMWVKPNFNPSNTTNNYSNILFASNYPDQYNNTFYLIISSLGGLLPANYIILVLMNSTKTESLTDCLIGLHAGCSIALADVKDWNANQWKHLGLSWDLNNATGNREIKLSIDGEPFSDINMSPYYPDDFVDPVNMDNPYGRFFIGSMYNSTETVGYYNQTNGTIDEFKIYNSTRTEAQFFADMINDYDVFYRERNGSEWSNITMVSNESNYMSLNPSVSELGSKTYISWSQADSDCVLTSTEFYNCAFFRIHAAMYNGTMNQLGIINEESTGSAGNPETKTYSNKIFYIFEDNSNLAGYDVDAYLKETTSSTKPQVNLSNDLNGNTYTVEDPNLGTNVTLSASASDIDSSISNVAFYYTADGMNGEKACTATADPGLATYFSCNWSVKWIAEDYYKISAIATSNDGGRNRDISDYLYLDTSSGINTYLMTSSINNTFYYKGYWNWTDSERPSISPAATVSLGSQYSSIDTYKNFLSSVDGSYVDIHFPPNCRGGDYVNSLLSVFQINETPSAIESLGIYWIGRGYTKTSYLTNMSIWSFADSAWISLAYKDFTSEQDDILRYTITKNVEDYISTENNSVYVLVETQDSAGYHCKVSLTIGCPAYSSWNGEEFVFETEGLLGLLNKQMESETYNKLNHAEEDNGKIKVKISEIIPEVLYLNSAKLIAVDHPAGTEAYLDPEGNPHVVDPEEVKKVECADRFGDDCSSLVQEADEKPMDSKPGTEGNLVSSRSINDAPPVDYAGNAWVSDVRRLDLDKDTDDYLYITLPGVSRDQNKDQKTAPDAAKLIISGSETGFKSFSELSLFYLGKDNLPVIYSAIDGTFFGRIMKEKISESTKITLQIPDENGQWKDYPYPQSYDNAIMGSYTTLVFPLNISLIKDSRIRIKMIAFAYMIDFIGVDYSADSSISAGYSEPDAPELKERDDSRKVVSEGESIEMIFKKPGITGKEGYSNGSRSYFLMTSGYYHPFESLVAGRKGDYNSGILDIANVFASTPAYAALLADSDYTKRILIHNYINGGFNALSDSINSNSPVLGSLKDRSGNNSYPKKHNSLYTDLIKVSVGTCTSLINNLKITQDTVLCRGNYLLADSDANDPSLVGIAQIIGSNLTFDCNGSTIIGGGNLSFGGQVGSGVAIGVNITENVVIKNCNITGYQYAIGINHSINITVENNTIAYVQVGIGAENANNSLVYNNTVSLASLSAYSFTKGSFNNTLENNTALNSLLGFALETSNNNTIRNNVINASLWSFSYIGGIAVFTGSNYNRIDNNTMENLLFGLGIADVGRFMNLPSRGYGGMWNNFSRNTVINSFIASIGLLLPYPDDYFNYFENSNVIIKNNLNVRENISYYLNVHGTPSNYTQITGFNLSMQDTSIFIGKITLVNCSYVNVSTNNLSNNFYDLLLVNSSNITISNNELDSATDTFNIYGSTGALAGVSIMMISSKDITVFNNTADSSLFGYAAYNGSDSINFTDNTATSSSEMGFYLHSLNNSYIINNTALGNTHHGIHIYNVENSTVQDNILSENEYGLTINHSLGMYINNTIYANTIAGMLLYNHLGAAGLSGNIIENNTGAGIMITSTNGESYSGLATHNNSGAGIYLFDSDNVEVIAAQSNKSRWSVSFNNTNNSQFIDLYTANSTDAEILFHKSFSNKIINSVIVNNLSAYDVNSSNNSNNYMLNTSFNRSNTVYGDEESNLSVQWHLDFYVQSNDSFMIGESIPIPYVNITVRSSEGDNDDQTLFTDAGGYAYFNVSEYRENNTGRTYLSNYTWNLTKFGYSYTTGQIRPYETSTNMTENKLFNLSMILIGGINDTTPPTTPIVLDGPDYVDIDWFNSRSMLQASWYNSTDRFLVFYAFRILDNGKCVPGYCMETEAGQNTSITINGLNLTEGHNYTFAVRARDSFYWFTPFAFSDGATADFTKPTVTVNSTTHPNQTEWYSNPNATLAFYGNDTLSGVGGFSYLLDGNPGTGPDLIADPKPLVTLAESKNNGYHRVLKANSTGQAFVVFSQARGNLSYGDNITVSLQLSEDISDRTDEMSVRVYLLRGTESIDGYDKTSRRISTIGELTQDITHKDYAAADTYSVDLTALSSENNLFYIAVEGSSADDNNTHNLSIAGTDSLLEIDNSTQAFICGETASCSNITNTADFAIGVKAETNSTTWTKTYYNLANGIHWFHVRPLDNAGNWGEPEHYAIQIDAVTGVPQFISITPKGYIATTSPTLAAETNEYSTCYYNVSTSAHVGMTSYDGTHHKSELSLSEGTYTYGLNCTDKSGNTAYNSTTFIINTSALPDTVSIWPMTNYTAGQKITVNVNVTKDYGGVAYGLGELSSRFSANITDSDSTKTSVSVSVTDKGNGLYTVSFTAPLTAGTYTLTVKVGDVLDTETFLVNSYSLTMKYTGTLDSAVAQENLVYGKAGSDYIIGFASDTTPTTITGTTSELLLKYIAANGNGFMFMTDSHASITDKQDFLSEGTFLDQDNPSFGHDLNEKEHVVSTILGYDDLHIIGDDTVYEGRYSLLIRNDGVNASSGKTKIKITIT